MSEVDVNGDVLATFTDVKEPQHLSTDSKGHLLIADYDNDRILLLSSKLQVERILADTDSQVKLWYPWRLFYNELTSQLCVVHSSSERILTSDTISQLSLR